MTLWSVVTWTLGLGKSRDLHDLAQSLGIACKKMLWTTLLALLFVIAVNFHLCDGKTAEEWKGRIIYQVIGVVW